MTTSLPPIRVLSIQSHVVHGYVGNKCATFALQTHGIEVDPINTVQFSNNTGYPSWKGQVLQADQLWDLYEGLVANQLDSYTHVLTGYVNNKGTLETIVKIVKALKEKNPDMKYFCDPVMGDGGKLYPSVPLEMVDLYRTLVFPLADSIKLNQTELEHLTRTKITNEEEAWKAITMLHDFDVEHVVVSSVDYLGLESIGVLASTMIEKDKYSRYSMTVAKRNLYYTGTGDLFSALLLAWLYKQNYENIGEAMQKVVSAIQHVLDNSNDEANENLKMKEIRLIKSAPYLTTPTLLIPFKAHQ